MWASTPAPVISQDGDVYGGTVNLASRIASYAQAGQVVVSEETAQRSGDPENVSSTARSSSRASLNRCRSTRPTASLRHSGLVQLAAQLNAKHTAIRISHITSRRQIEQDERVAKGITNRESANLDLSRLEDPLRPPRGCAIDHRCLPRRMRTARGLGRHVLVGSTIRVEFYPRLKPEVLAIPRCGISGGLRFVRMQRAMRPDREGDRLRIDRAPHRSDELGIHECHPGRRLRARGTTPSASIIQRES